MGIAGLYQELGSGKRVSLAKLSAEHFVSTGIRLRIAVDASIWAFQVQAGKGGNNPALRTLYYRLIRLLHLNITPLFVFDGPHRPVFKRNHKTNTRLTPSLTRSTKALLKLFGFPYHDAPGEAEAECANLQQRGVVDAVLSEDVDTLMFGCGVTMRNWSGEGGKSKVPTHVTVYERDAVKSGCGITAQGMVLVALMRGGDYLPEGVPRCGIKIAMEAARAGFGEKLCALGVGDAVGLKEWREGLQMELETNQHGWFKRKNKSIRIPEGFPDKTVLGYYTNPVVSSLEKVERLKEKICWSGKIDIAGLRESARWAFEWRGKLGAAKFIRCLAPAVLSWNLCTATEDVRDMVLGFHGRREHFSTGECREIRISFVPRSVVVVDMAAEDNDEVDAEPEDDDEFALAGEEGPKKAKDYDPSAVERMWVLEVFVRQGIPEMVAEYEVPKPKTKKSATTTRKPRRGTKGKDVELEDVAAMLGDLSISKPNHQNSGSKSNEAKMSTLAERLVGELVLEDDSPGVPPSPRKPNSRRPLRSGPATPNARRRPNKEPSEQEDIEKWTSPERPHETLRLSPPRGRRYSALGIYGAPLSPQEEPTPSPTPPRSFPTVPTLLPPTCAQSQRPKGPSGQREGLGPQTTPSGPRDTPLRHALGTYDVSLPSQGDLTLSPTQPTSPPMVSPLPPTIQTTSSPKPREPISIPSSPEPSIFAPHPTTPSHQRKSTPTPIHNPDRPTTQKSPKTSLFVLDISDSGPGPEAEPPSSQILSPNITTRNKRAGNNQIPLPPLPPPPPPPIFSIFEGEQEADIVEGRTTRKVVLRESLEGSWTFANNAWGEERKGWEQVEVIDLTGN